MSYQPPPDPEEIEWNVGREGRAWSRDEAWPRYELTPEKIEMVGGKVFGTDEDRLRMLGMLLENCGAEAAVRFGDPAVWRQAVASLSDPEATFRHALEAAHRRRDNSYGEAAGLLRLHEQITTEDFAEFAKPGEATPTATREEALAALRRAAETETPCSPDYSTAETRADAIGLEGDGAVALLTRTLRHRRYEKIDERQWRLLPEVVEIERWREKWTNTEGGWRLQRRERVEGPWAVAGGEAA